MASSSTAAKPEPHGDQTPQIEEEGISDKAPNNLQNEREVSRDVVPEENSQERLVSMMKSLGTSLEAATKRSSKSQIDFSLLKGQLSDTIRTMADLCKKGDRMQQMVMQQKGDLEGIVAGMEMMTKRMDTLESRAAAVQQTPDNVVSESVGGQLGDDHASHAQVPPAGVRPGNSSTAASRDRASDGLILAGRWVLGEKIGSGAGGSVCKVWDMVLEKHLAAKLEVVGEHEDSPLMREYQVYQLIHHPEPTYGFSAMHFFGNFGPFDVLVLDRFGPSLVEYFQSERHPRMILQAALQCVDRIEALHDKDIVHRDIKPENFLVHHTSEGLPEIKLIDFGLATRIPRDGNCCAKGSEADLEAGSETVLPFFGTVLYAPLAAHHGVPQALKDDMEAFGYVLIKLFKGSLPWEDIEGSNVNEVSDIVLQKKMNTPISQLCAGLPEEIIVYFKHVLTLNRNDVPDYDGLRFLLSNAMTHAWN